MPENRPDRRVLITGASKGIGRAVADRIAARGFQPIGVARTAPESFPGPFYPVDLADRAATADTLTAIVDDGHVDAVVNNVGFAHFGRLGSIDLDHLFETYDLNVRTAVQVVQAVLPGMIDRGWGRIVNVHEPDHVGHPGTDTVRGGEGGAGNLHTDLGAGTRRDGYHRECGGTRPHGDRDVSRAQPGRLRARKGFPAEHSDASRRKAGGDRTCDLHPVG